MMASTVPTSISLVLCILATIASGDKFSPIIKTISGNQVPLATLQERSLKLTAETARVLLYDVDKDFRLQGHGIDIDLRQLTGESRRLSTESVTLVVDGKKADFSAEDAGYLRTGPQFSVAHTADGEVIAVWGPGMALSPVHSTQHPGVFVNLAKQPYNPMTRKEAKQGFSPGEGRHFYGHDTEEISEGVTEISEELDTSQGTVRQSTSCESRSDTYKLSLATASDRGMCAKYGDRRETTANAIVAAIALASAPYDSQTCLSLVSTYVELTCSDGVADPWGGLRSTDDPLNAFQSKFNEIRSSVPRDVAYYFPSYFDDTSASGVAFIGTACRLYSAYGWVENLEPIVIAHEIGHNLNCLHVVSGLMKSSWSRSDPIEFAATSVNTINAFVNSIKRGPYADECMLEGTDGPPVTVPPATSSAPQPTRRPPGLPISCASTFSAWNAFKCDLLYNNVFGTTWARTSFRVRQRSNGMVAIIRTRNRGARIHRAAMSVYMGSEGPDLIPEDVGAPKRKMTFLVSMEEVYVQSGQTACCNRTVWIQLVMYVCDGSSCATLTLRLSRLMQCEECLRTYRPASLTRRCNRCRN